MQRASIDAATAFVVDSLRRRTRAVRVDTGASSRMPITECLGTVSSSNSMGRGSGVTADGAAGSGT